MNLCVKPPNSQIVELVRMIVRDTRTGSHMAHIPGCVPLLPLPNTKAPPCWAGPRASGQLDTRLDPIKAALQPYRHPLDVIETRPA